MADSSVVAAFRRAIRDTGASRKPAKALFEAGSVESGLRNLDYGDSDSLGALQQRPSQGWKNARDPYKAALDFLKQAIPLSGKYGSSGQLAQAVQRSAYPDRYDEHSQTAEQYLKGTATGQPQPQANTASADRLGYNPGASQVDLSNVLPPQKGLPQATAPQAPEFAAKPPGQQTAYKTPGPSPEPKQRFDQGAAVEALQTLAQPSEAPSSTVVKGEAASSSSSPTPKSVGWPTAKKGDLIGAPHSGTHTLGNWQSDNAIDIGVPVGTPMVALQGGVVLKVTKHPQGSGRFAGDQITIRGANGNEYFYAHGVADVKAGQKVKKGQSLGTTGSANGVAHLHFGQMKGDPREHTR